MLPRHHRFGSCRVHFVRPGVGTRRIPVGLRRTHQQHVRVSKSGVRVRRERLLCRCAPDVQSPPQEESLSEPVAVPEPVKIKTPDASLTVKPEAAPKPKPGLIDRAAILEKVKKIAARKQRIIEEAAAKDKVSLQQRKKKEQDEQKKQEEQKKKEQTEQKKNPVAAANGKGGSKAVAAATVGAPSKPAVAPDASEVDAKQLGVDSEESKVKEDVQTEKQAETGTPEAAKEAAKEAGAGPAVDVKETTLGKATESSDKAVTSPGSARLAVAAKISAARALARRLAEEKAAAAAAAAAAKLAGSSANANHVELIKKSAEVASTHAAKEVARADTLARAVKKAEMEAQQLRELQRMKAENEALQQLVLEVAVDKKEAHRRLISLKDKFKVLVDKMGSLVDVDEEVEPELPAVAGVTEMAAETVVDALAEPLPIEASVAAEEAVESIPQTVPSSPWSPPAPSSPWSAPPTPPQIDEAQERMRLEEEEAAENERQKEEAMRRAVQAAAKTAVQQATVFFSMPPAAPPGTRCWVYYNRPKGPLPYGGELALKAGYNKWASMVTQDMRPASDLKNMAGCEWWAVQLQLPPDLFKVDFVVMDKRTGAVDNNKGSDFQLRISGNASEEEVILKRAIAYEKWEKKCLRMLDEEEDKLMVASRAEATKEGQVARHRFRDRQKEQLMAEAWGVVNERRTNDLDRLQSSPQIHGVLKWIGGEPRAGEMCTLAYNRNSGSLMHSPDVVVHVGFDGWWMKEKKEYAMERISGEQAHNYGLDHGDWYCCSVAVPNSACILNYVFSDKREQSWDNNNNRDYHARIANAPSREELVQKTYRLLEKQTDLEAVKSSEDRAAKSAEAKVERKAQAARKRRELLRSFLFTDPMMPKAGQPVTLYYNPDNTVLRGRPEVWLHGSWNRWAPGRGFRPQMMEPVVAGADFGFLKATLQVPEDANMMDAVFCDTGDGAGVIYDNNRGLDYHIPVVGGTTTAKSLHVVHVTVEMAPIAKVGGLGDVVTALGRAVQEEGHAVDVILPRYDVINYGDVQNLSWQMDYNWAGTTIKVWRGTVEGLNTIFLDPLNGNFMVGCIYGRNDDHSRFNFFCNAALEYLRISNLRPDVLHCHDWQTAPVAFGDKGDARSVFTIHNMNYGADLIGRAMGSSAVATTVSPTYASEISGHPSIAPYLDKFYGIRNGIDMSIWDPMEDKFLTRCYGVADVEEGKAAAKHELRKRMKLCDADVPLVAVVTRLTHQKGIHLIKHAAWRVLERGGQFVLLGSAPDGRVQAEFNALASELGAQYPDRARLLFAYNEPLSHLIYAGSDIFLVPSIFEPCGLTQMIAMRYGTIPLVRRTGGLNDTVFDIDLDEERAASCGMQTNGFSFDGTEPAGMDLALNRAMSTWYTDRDMWHHLTERVMQQDWSWYTPATDYIELYYKALK